MVICNFAYYLTDGSVQHMSRMLQYSLSSEHYAADALDHEFLRIFVGSDALITITEFCCALMNIRR